MTKVFGRVKSKLEETKIWLKRKEKRKSAVANEIFEIKSREIKNQESLPDFLVRMIEMERTLKINPVKCRFATISPKAKLFNGVNTESVS